MPVEIEPELTIESAVLMALDALQRSIWTAIPGKVSAWNPLTQRATITPGVKDGDRGLPELLDVPVYFPRAGGYILTFPIEVGSPGLVVFSAVSPAEWFARGAVTTPLDQRRHTISGGVFIPGFDPSPVDRKSVV